MAVVFFDIDGTILDRIRQDVVPSAAEAIQKLRTNGHLAFLNTGRPLSTIPPAVWRVGFDGVVASCGTSIRYRSEVLREVLIPDESMRALTEALEDSGLRVVLEGPEFVYVMDLDDGAYADDMRLYKSQGMDVFRGWKGEKPAANKFTYLTQFAPDFSGLEDFLRPDFRHIRYGDDMGDWIPWGHDKATGIECVLRRLGVGIEDTYAFGDSINDVEMLGFVRHGVAMADGDPSLADLCEYVTASCLMDGIRDGLMHFGLI